MASRRDARALAQPLALERVKASSEACLNFEQRDEIYFRGQTIISLPDELLSALGRRSCDLLTRC